MYEGVGDELKFIQTWCKYLAACESNSEKLQIPAAAVAQIRIGTEDKFEGLVHWRAIYNEGVKGFFYSFYVYFASIVSCKSDVIFSNYTPESESVLELQVEMEKRADLIKQLADIDLVIDRLIYKRRNSKSIQLLTTVHTNGPFQVSSLPTWSRSQATDQ